MSNSDILFTTVVADPPWPYRAARAMPVRKDLIHNSYGGNISSRERYGAMTLAELRKLQVRKLSNINAHLYLWTTNSFMAEAHELSVMWGFEPKTIITWAKIKKDRSPSMKMGYYFRGATEHIIFAVRGSLKLQTTRCYPTFFTTTRLGHSHKPEEFYEMVEDCSPGPYLELFARRLRKGWESWGNQVISSVDL